MLDQYILNPTVFLLFHKTELVTEQVDIAVFAFPIIGKVFWRKAFFQQCFFPDRSFARFTVGLEDTTIELESIVYCFEKIIFPVTVLFIMECRLAIRGSRISYLPFL